MSMKPSVLFVCLGNICRSPLAEAALREEAGRLGIEVHVDSAGTGDWHVGQPPDRRAIAVADPYYGGEANFDETWADVTAGARTLARTLGRQ